MQCTYFIHLKHTTLPAGASFQLMIPKESAGITRNRNTLWTFFGVESEVQPKNAQDGVLLACTT